MESMCKRATFILPVIALCSFFVVCHGDHDAHGDHGNYGDQIHATCIIQPMGFSGINISGEIKLTQTISTGITTLFGHLYGFENRTVNKRGFHVHQVGSTDGNCTAAGLHYNPLNNTHGAPNDTVRHVGDLGNIVVDPNLESRVNISDNVISLRGNYSIINRTLVVHSGEDDLGRGGNADSLTTGNSGYRIGCCVITLDPDVTPASSAPTQSTPVSAATSVSHSGAILLCLAGLQLLVSRIRL